MTFTELPTPCYVVDEAAMIQNLEILQGVAQRTGCKILLAQKAFSLFGLYPLMGKYLSGTAASGLFEARLGKTEMGGECHVYSPAYTPSDFAEILQYADHVVFNTPAQVRKFGAIAQNAGKSLGLRINPRHSTQEGHEIYDPCAAGSRLGTTVDGFDMEILPMLEGLHMHTLCEQGAEPLEATVAALEQQFGHVLPELKWLNLGGGHHITKAGYNLKLLEQIVTRLQRQYQLQVYLEPGEAVALNAGYFITTVLDTMENSGVHIAIMDGSAACHMPDVLEMPYRPPLQHSGLAGEKPFTYRLGGPTCLAGDILGEFSFDTPIAEGSRLVFEDMAIYTMVKNNTFNGMKLPSIYLQKQNGDCELLREFSYEDFRMRLG